jgi:anaerobic selenocysteine-containing dehydrogenase
MDQPTKITTRPTICCACSQQCGLTVHFNEEVITRITGDKTHPSSAGFICPKGSRAHELHYSADRVHVPHKRVGRRGSGEWEEISWDQALDEIADKLKRLVVSDGAETIAHSIGTLHGADWGIGERFMNLFGSPNTVGQDKICYGPTAVGETLTYGFGPTTFTFPVPGKTQCIVIWGMRPSASSPLLWRQMLRARAAGAKLVVIDPEFTKEARKADYWLQLQVGSDVALGLGLLHTIINENLHDVAVAHDSVGFDALTERVQQYPLDKVSELCRIPSEKIAQVARLVATVGPTIFSAGNGLCQSGNMAVQNGRTVACLVALTGNLNRDGGHTVGGPPRDMINNGAAMAVDALSAEQRAKRLGGADYPFIGAGYDAVDAAMSRRWYGQKHLLSWIATAHEPAMWQAIETGKPYPIKALILQYHNPVGASANINRIAAALKNERLELLVAHDLFMNASSRLADYVLPAAHWLERPFFSYGYGYMAFVGDYLETQHAPLPAEFEHRSDYDLWRDLGQRLGQADQWPNTATEFWQSLITPVGLDFSTVAEHTGPIVGTAVQHPERHVADSTVAYGTPSGQIEFASSLLEQWGLDPLPYFAKPEIFEHADDYPLILTTGGRKLDGFHQNSQQMPWFRRKYPEPEVSLHPDTAADYGVEAGAWVQIETPVGSVRQRARLTMTLAPGTVHADRWWYPEQQDDADDPYWVAATNINCCTTDAPGDCDPIIGGWLLRGVPCRLTPGVLAAGDNGDTGSSQ